jgi:hypothetical protein
MGPGEKGSVSQLETVQANMKSKHEREKCKILPWVYVFFTFARENAILTANPCAQAVHKVGMVHRRREGDQSTSWCGIRKINGLGE